MEEITSPPISRRPISRVLPTSPRASRFTRTFSGRDTGASSSSSRGWDPFTARTRPARMADRSAGGTSSGHGAVHRDATPSSSVSWAGSVTGKVSRPARGGR